jgi:hypothetical protein
MIFRNQEDRGMSRNHAVSVLVLALFYAGCAGMPLSTMYTLKSLDPMEVDPAQLKVAVRADERIGIPRDGVHLSLKFDADDGSLNIDDTYVVEVIRNPILTPELYDDKAKWESVTVLQLSEKDAQRLARVQSLLKPYTDGSASGSLSFGVDVKGVCAHSPIPPGRVLIDIFVQASTEDGFFAITRDLDLRQGADGSDTMIAGLSECQNLAGTELTGG